MHVYADFRHVFVSILFFFKLVYVVTTTRFDSMQCQTSDLGHEAVVMPQPVDLWVSVQPPNSGTMHITAHKADTYALGLG